MLFQPVLTGNQKRETRDGRSRGFHLLAPLLFALIAFLFAAARDGQSEERIIIPEGFRYPPEHIYDTRVYSDEALVNVQISSHRWPNCTTFEQAIQDVFRLEGAGQRSDQEKALALWKWFRILVSSTGNGLAFEGETAGHERYVVDAMKILGVYGHHQCDGLSWTMVPLWRAAGYIAFDEAAHWHTTASLRYRDRDGSMRFHSFDPQERFLWWNRKLDIVGNRTLPIMQDTVHRHLKLPQKVHSLRTSLHIGETIERKWMNEGYIVPSGKQPKKIHLGDYYRYRPGRTDGIYASAGSEVQTFTPDISPLNYSLSLFETSRNIACKRFDDGSSSLHSVKSGQVAEAVYRVSSPYVAVDATCEAVVTKGNNEDVLQLYLSRDGKTWELIFDKPGVGEESIMVHLGRKAREAGRPHIYTAYTFFLKVRMMTEGEASDVGLKGLRVKVYRMLNKRTLMNLLPGENIIRVDADKILASKALELTVDYAVKDRDFTVRHVMQEFPYYFRIDIENARPYIRDNYDQAFGLGDIRMGSINMRLVDVGGENRAEESEIAVAVGEKKFREASPHPAGKLQIHKKLMKKSESDPSQTDGFFPQYEEYRKDKDKLPALIQQLREGGDSSPRTWRAAEELGNYPEALDALLEKLPEANIDLTVYICKALAKLKDKRAIGTLLKKWDMAPEGAPGTRYIPDVLGEIGDPCVVPDLVSKLTKVRFDFRFHIAHALGKLGGPVSLRALEELSRYDPFPAVREEALECLKRLGE